METAIARVGFWGAVNAFLGVAGYDASVPLQVLNLVTPLQDATFASSLIIATPFLLAMVALHYTVPGSKKFWTSVAIVLSVIYTTYCSINYIVQLTTVIPAGSFWTLSNQQGTQGPLSLLNQIPHSLFWDLDGLGYLFMGFDAVCVSSLREKWLGEMA